MAKKGKIAIVAVAAALWVAGTAWGLVRLHAHETAPGRTEEAPSSWPAGSRLRRDAARNTLVLFAHPRCPCTKATLGELDRLVAHVGRELAVTVVFFEPADWAETDLWRRAAAIPGVATVRDRGGLEAERFGAVTSGDAFLYDAAGKLVFRGGITGSRGHEGDNAGRAAIEAFVLEGRGAGATARVYGCPMRTRSGP